MQSLASSKTATLQLSWPRVAISSAKPNTKAMATRLFSPPLSDCVDLSIIEPPLWTCMVCTQHNARSKMQSHGWLCLSTRTPSMQPCQPIPDALACFVCKPSNQRYWIQCMIFGTTVVVGAQTRFRPKHLVVTQQKPNPTGVHVLLSY